MTFVSYEDFGAIGDGIADDQEAIIAAHEYANTRGLPIRTKPTAEYYIGGGALTAVIKTDTDWSTTRFVIDDRGVEDFATPCFLVPRISEPQEFSLESLEKNQTKLEFYPKTTSYILVSNSKEKKFIRYGLNPSPGEDTTDCFLVDPDGSILSPIDWNYDHVTEAVTWPLESETLTIQGGIFTTIANQAKSVYNYNSRGIDIGRSNTTIDGLSHCVIAEGSTGSPYRGFLSAEKCANIRFQNCFSTGHKIYTTIGRANLPVKMGSYDLHANQVINLTLENCRMNHIDDKTRWGVFASNFCKNIRVENCHLSRIDAHMGVSGTYIIRNTQLGHQGINAIGKGSILLENVRLKSRSFLRFREDYGSTWEGRVIIRGCTWIVDPEDGPATPEMERESHLIFGSDSGNHDFGYPCSMPERVEIEDLDIDDRFCPDDWPIFLFSRPYEGANPSPEQAYPYELPKTVGLRNVRIGSGKFLRVCSDERIFESTEIHRL